MDILNTINSYTHYKTKYFETISEFAYTFDLSCNTFLSVICINIRSANANFNNLLLSFENDVNFKQLDVIILTETWHGINNCSYSIPGFQICYTKMKRNQNDGIIVFIRNTLTRSLSMC